MKASDRQLMMTSVIAVLVTLASATAGCTNSHLTGGVIGGAAIGGAYEYQNKRALDQLEHERRSGRISEEEYHRRREEIDDRSLLY